MTATETAAPVRYYGLDAVRAFALLLGLALHAAMSFIEPQIWILKETETSPALAVTFYVIHAFRMTLFFILAGFFGRLLIENRGVLGFVKNRLSRIALPLGVFWPLVLMGIIAVLIGVGARLTAANGGVAPPAPPPPTLETLPLTHLWFLYVLLLLYPVALILRYVTRPAAALVDGLMRLSIKLGFAALLFAIPVILTTALTPDWMYWFGIKTPDTGLVPNLAALVGFGTAFGFGWMLHRQPDLLKSLGNWSGTLLIEGAIGLAICLYLVGPTPLFEKIAGQSKPIYTALYFISAWLLSLGLIGAGHAILNKNSQVIRYLSDASYWIYIIHIPVVMALQVAFIDLTMNPILKWALIVWLTFLVGLSSYALLVRHSVIGVMLNGKRKKTLRESAK
ncbi:MAG: acyltransferase family protein [Asticcacaulis sp.]